MPQTKGPERFLSALRQVRMVEGGSRRRGSQLVECSLGQALQGTLAILAKVRPADLNPGLGPAGYLAAFLGRVV